MSALRPFRARTLSRCNDGSFRNPEHEARIIAASAMDRERRNNTDTSIQLGVATRA